MKIVEIINILVIGIFLTSCSSTVDRLKRIGKAPDFAKLEVPVDDKLLSVSEKEAQAKDRTRRTNSLWQPGSTSFFRDSRAWKVGDIVRVEVSITDKATLANSTTQTRDDGDGMQMTQLFGKVKPFAKTLNMMSAGAAVPTEFLNVSSKRNNKGTGNINRSESIQTEVAVLVRQVLPNGNLIIEGHQEIRINHELREIKVAGIIRPKDIDSSNSIGSDKIAEARISYGGRGVVSDMQQPRVGSQIVDIIAPF